MRLLLTLACLFAANSASAGIVFLSNDAGGLGELIDETDLADLPATFAVPGISPSLNFTITAIGGNGAGRDVNSTATSLGVNSDGADDTDAFDATLGESITFRFDVDVDVTQLDFTTFENGETFEFAGQTIANGDLSNGTTDVYDFSTPLRLDAGVEYTMQATAGTIGIEGFNITAVPEPSGFAFIGLLATGLLRTRRRRRS